MGRVAGHDRAGFDQIKHCLSSQVDNRDLVGALASDISTLAVGVKRQVRRRAAHRQPRPRLMRAGVNHTNAGFTRIGNDNPLTVRADSKEMRVDADRDPRHDTIVFRAPNRQIVRREIRHISVAAIRAYSRQMRAFSRGDCGHNIVTGSIYYRDIVGERVGDESEPALGIESDMSWALGRP